MPRYIDAEDFESRMQGHVEEYMWEVLEETPTADVAVVKRGYWQPLKKGDKGYSAGDVKCSVCGEPNHTWLPRPNFCSVCGADMRGGRHV